MGVVHNPATDETFHATKGGGAFLVRRGAERKLAVSATRTLGRAAIVTEFGYDRTPEGATVPVRGCPASGPVTAALPAGVDEMLGRLRNLLVQARIQGIRSMGSAALNLCAVAAGWLDAYYEGKKYAAALPPPSPFPPSPRRAPSELARRARAAR